MGADEYQARYLAHLARKALILEGRDEGFAPPGVGAPEVGFAELALMRRTIRRFTARGVEVGDLRAILEAVRHAPSSCNRQAIIVKVVSHGPALRALENLLVGGAGWLAGANVALLFFADMTAYKSPAEVDFMPTLDAGGAIMSAIYQATDLGLGSAWVNPHVRLADRARFAQLFNSLGYLFCSALALGYPTRIPAPPPLRTLAEVDYDRRPGAARYPTRRF